MSSRARSTAIVAKASAVPEIASEIADAIRYAADTVSEALITHAAVMASIAAAHHSKGYPEQRDMGEVIFADGETRFEELRKGNYIDDSLSL